MIRYALACDQGHGFETRFRDSASYDDQVRAGLVACPACGSSKVEKQIMAPAVARTDRPPALPPPGEGAAGVTGDASGGTPAPADPVAQEGAPPAAAPMVLMGEREHAFRALLRAMREHVVATAENVGPRFADEARKMHDGLSEFRAIYGEATADEARALAEEGIAALPLPILPDDLN
jgi:hypothetical protein